MVLGTTSGVAPGVSTSRELSSTSTVCSTLPLCTCFSDLSLQSSCVEVSIFSALELVSLGHVSCSDLENLVFSMAIQVQGLEYQLELYLSNSAIRALLVSLQDICVDMSVLVLLLAVLKPPSLQYAALRSLEDWTLDVDILVVVCFVDTAVLNVYNSDAFHHLASEFRVHLAQNLLSVSAYGVQLAHSRSQSQGKSKEANKVPFLHQDRVRQAPRSHPDAAWNKDKSTSGLGWVFSGSGQETPIHGSTVESFISSPLIAEAITIQSTLSMALTLEFSTLKVLSDSLTLTRAISSNIQSKEIIGIVKDIRAISSGFATISFYHVSKSDNFVADGLAKRLSKPISLCNEHHDLGHRFGLISSS